MAKARLTISSRTYSSWSLRGWLLCRMAGLDFEEDVLPVDDPSARAELLLLSPSFRVPRLVHGDVRVWDTLAIAEYLNETFPEAGLYPEGRGARALCRSVSGEMHAGFYNLRSALPMNLRAHHPGFRVWAGTRPDIDRVVAIWRDCLAAAGGPFLFGPRPAVADAFFAPVCTRFRTYDVALDAESAAYCGHVLAWGLMGEWIAAAREEPAGLEELDAEF